MAARGLVIILAYLAAAVAASATVAFSVMGILLKSGQPMPNMPDAIAAVLQAAATVFVPLAVSAFLPSMMVSFVAEIYRLRSAIFYMLGAVVISIISSFGLKLVLSLVMFQPKGESRLASGFFINWPLAAAGAVGGLVYWAIAGRNAGAWRQAKR